MSFGVNIFDATGRQKFVDVPLWVIDMRTNLNGSGTLTYDFDTNLFKLDPLPCVWRYDQKPTLSVNGNSFSYSNAVALWVMVRLVRK